jgi:hypothetical protein
MRFLWVLAAALCTYKAPPLTLPQPPSTCTSKSTQPHKLRDLNLRNRQSTTTQQLRCLGCATFPMPPKQIAPASPQATQAAAPPQGTVPWDLTQPAAIPSHGSTLVSYGKYEVPWNGRVTVEEWMYSYWRASPPRQKAIVDDWLSSPTEYLHLTSNVVAAAANTFVANRDLMGMCGGEKGFYARHPVIRDIKSYQENHRAEMLSSFAGIREIEPPLMDEALHPYSESVVTSHTGATTIAYLLRRFPA